MLEIPLAQWNYIDLTKATVRLVIVATKERYLRQQFSYRNAPIEKRRP